MHEPEHGSNSPKKPPQTKAEKHPQPVSEYEQAVLEQEHLKQRIHVDEHGSASHEKEHDAQTKDRTPSTKKTVRDNQD